MARTFIHLRHPETGRTQRIVAGSKAADAAVARFKARGFVVYEPEAPYDAAAEAPRPAKPKRQRASRSRQSASGATKGPAGHAATQDATAGQETAAEGHS